MEPKKLYWLNAMSADELSAERLDLEAISPSRVGRHDIFATANFFNFAPWAAAVELILERGVQPIFEYDRGIICAHRRGRIRISPHLYNTEDDIDRALEILRAV